MQCPMHPVPSYCKEASRVSPQLTTVRRAGGFRQTYPFALADLPYAYDALEPHIDQKTLQVHHRGHHATYVKKLNEARGEAFRSCTA